MSNEKKKSFLQNIVDNLREIHKKGTMTDEEIRRIMEEDSEFIGFAAVNPNTIKQQEKPKPRELTKEELEEARRVLWEYLDNPEYIDKEYLNSQRGKRY